MNKAAVFSLAPELQLAHNAGVEKPNIIFEAVRDNDAPGWHVVISLPDGNKAEVRGFKTEHDAKKWVALESKSWLEGYSGGRYV